MAKKCPPGKYYCFTDKKCKKIPRGYRIGARGYLARGDNRSDSGNGNGNGNGNGSSNGNGNGGNGSGNGNGSSGGNGGGNGGGGMGESIVYETLNSKDKPFVKKLVGKLRKGSKTHAKQADDLEKAMTEESNPRIPRKKGQPAKSKKHSDLYTDEDPKGTIHGLGFKDVAKAKASVSKIRNSSRSHAHKIQAAVAMEQRAREMGKTSEAAVYRKYINAMKKKTKRMNEAANPAQQAAIAIDMKRKGKKPKNVKESIDHSVAVTELEDGLKNLKVITYDSVDQLMQGIAKRNGISETLLHNKFKAKHLQIPDDWAIRYRMNKMKGIEEEKMTPAEKRKDTMLKKKYDKSDMKKSMQDQYGKEEGKKVYFATIRKQAMSEMVKKIIPKYKQKFLDRQLKQTPQRTVGKLDTSELDLTSKLDTPKPIKPKKGQVMQDEYKYNVSEEGLRDWFGKSSGTTKSGRKVRGWVQVGGKYDGKPCARQPGQKSTPKCVSSAKRRSMSKSERDSAARRKRAADPNQPQKSGAAKPTNVSTDPKRKMKEEFTTEMLGAKAAMKAVKRFGASTKMDGRLSKAASDFQQRVGASTGEVQVRPRKHITSIKKANPTYDANKMKYGPSKIAIKNRKIQVGGGDANKRLGNLTKTMGAATAIGMIGANASGKFNEQVVNEAKDKKGKGSGTKDACYHKVKSRYSVWPSAYASGALVKCRKVGAANWGNKTKKEGFSPMQVAALETAGMIELNEAGKKCWKGYEKKGTQTLFGKTYNRCVKKKSTKEEVEYTNEGVAFLKREKEKKNLSSEYLKQRDAGKVAKKIMAKKDQEKVNFLEPEETNEERVRLIKNGHTYKVVLTWRGKTYMIQMFVPSVSKPTRQEVEKEVQKIYPTAKVLQFLPKDYDPTDPTIMVGEEKRDEYGDLIDGPKISKKQKAKNLAKNEKDEQHTTTTSEEYVTEDDMKGMSVKSGHKRPTKAGAGMTKKGVEAYRRRNPGSKLKTAVTTKPSKLKKGSKAAKRRKSYCARSAGQMKKFPKAAKDPNSRLRQARRRWNC